MSCMILSIYLALIIQAVKYLSILSIRDWLMLNTKFKKTNSGDCMLDNAIKYENAEMIKLLLKYGATSDNKYI